MDASLLLLLPAPVERRCHLCDMPLFRLGSPFLKRGFVVVMRTGRAYCAACMDNQLPSRLDVFSLGAVQVELEACLDEIRWVVEAARFRPLRELRDRVAELSLGASVALEGLTTDAIQSCAVCGCWQTDDGEWHGYLHGEAWAAPKRSRSWLADDLCSGCLGEYTPENTLAGQCDRCDEFSTRLTVRPSSQWANCPDCATGPYRSNGKEGC